MGVKWTVRGADASAFGNPTFIQTTANGFVQNSNLKREYMMLDGTIDVAQTTFLDDIEGHVSTQAVNQAYGGLVRKSYGMQQSSHAFGSRLNTGVVDLGKGSIFMAARLTMGDLIDNFPWLVCRFSQNPDPGFGPLMYWNADNAANHNRIGLLDKTNLTIPAGSLIPAGDAAANQWNSIEYSWDSATGMQRVRTLGGEIEVTDADGITALQAFTAASATLQFGMMRYAGSLGNITGELGLCVVYCGVTNLTESERDHNMLRTAAIMTGRGVTVQAYTP
jgi:hypothetical protein